MSSIIENSLTFDGGEDKQLKLYGDTLNECYNISENVSKEMLFKLWDDVILSEKSIQKELEFLPTNKDLDNKIDDEKRKLQNAENELNNAKQLYSSANFEFRKIEDNVRKFFSLELNDKNEAEFLSALIKDQEDLLKQTEERLLNKKQKLLALTL